MITMKRLRGRTLEDIIHGLRAGRAEDLAAFPRYRLLQALASVCQAIGFAHGRGVSHLSAAVHVEIHKSFRIIADRAMAAMGLIL